jgi:hypothetical protein
MRDTDYFEKAVDTEARLGDVLTELLDSKIEPQMERFVCLSEALRLLMPPELSEHCRIGDVSGGQLRLIVDSASYMYQLQLCSADLLAGLKIQCPQLRITRLRIAVS